MCLAQELRRSLSKNVSISFWATPPPPTSNFSATRKKKRDYYFCRHLLSTYQSSQYDPRKSKSKYSLHPFVDTNKEMQLQLDIVLRKYEFETLLISK